MATPKSQRIGIIIIAAVMLIGTLGLYYSLIVSNGQDPVADAQQEQLAKQIEEQQKQQEDSARERQKNLRPLEGYVAEKFDAGSVTTLQKEDLVVGTGDEVSSGATIKANYTGWTPDGQIFDSTNENGTATPAEFPLSGVIQGWQEGIPGMKVGGVRKLTIPAEQAYGASGSAPFIAPNTPLVFIVQITEVV
jgi:FKBP-type peptidyl-prolyl cis-trans isomerase